MLVTPWLAAGAGIVVASGLALNVPRTVLTYTPKYPACQPPACGSTPAGHEHGGLAATDPGIKMEHARPVRAHRPAAGTPLTPAARAARTHANAVHPRGPVRRRMRSQVEVAYQAIQRWPTGFSGLITVTGQANLDHWRLAFRYPGAHIESVTGAKWLARGDGNGGVATAIPWPWGPPAGQLVRIMIIADGTPGQPTACRFDGARCSFG